MRMHKDRLLIRKQQINISSFIIHPLSQVRARSSICYLRTKDLAVLEYRRSSSRGTTRTMLKASDIIYTLCVLNGRRGLPLFVFELEERVHVGPHIWR